MAKKNLSCEGCIGKFPVWDAHVESASHSWRPEPHTRNCHLQRCPSVASPGLADAQQQHFGSFLGPPWPVRIAQEIVDTLAGAAAFPNRPQQRTTGEQSIAKNFPLPSITSEHIQFWHKGGWWWWGWWWWWWWSWWWWWGWWWWGIGRKFRDSSGPDVVEKHSLQDKTLQ